MSEDIQKCEHGKHGSCIWCCRDDNRRLQSQLSTLRKVEAELRGALEPFANFSRAWKRQPLSGLDDEFYGIHTGTEYEASLRISDCHKAAEALAKADEIAGGKE